MIDSKARIAIVEDDQDIAGILQATLEDHGFETGHFPTSLSFQSGIDAFRPDLCLIDLGLPDENGLELVKSLDAREDIATIIISGRRTLSDKIVGLELGADDYIAKPFEPAEIVARVRSLLRRARKSAPDENAPSKVRASFGNWTVDVQNFTLENSDGNVVSLSHAEMQIMKIFLNAPNRLLTRNQILDDIDSAADGSFDRAIDVRISRLRTKLGEDVKNPKMIKTVYGAGYIFVADIRWT